MTRSFNSSPWTTLALLAVVFGFVSLCGGCGDKNNLASLTAQSVATTKAIPTNVAFKDVTEAAGLQYKWSFDGFHPIKILQSTGNGCAFLDFNKDGNLDVLLIGPKLALFQGDGKGHFKDVTAQMGLDKLKGKFQGCAVGDYDGDGYDDIYISAYRGGVLLHNEAGKSFRDVTVASGLKAQPWGTSCAFADLSNSGKLDLYIGNYVVFSSTTDPQLCNMQGKMTSCGPRYYKEEHGTLYKNLGGGKFADITKQWKADKTTGKALGVAFADYDGSGYQSLAIANDEMAGDLMHNLHGKGFENVGATTSVAYDNDGNAHGGMGIDWGDYDNDGKLDLFVATFQGEVKCIYHNDQKFFTESAAQLGLANSVPNVAFGAKWIDFDNDGFLDLLIANGHVQDNIDAIDTSATYKQPTQLFHNENGKHFEDVSQTMLDTNAHRAIAGRGLAIGDFDNDGHVDALIVDNEGTPLLLHNESKSGSWVGFDLQQSGGNRHAYGAMVTVTTAVGRKLLRQCQPGGSYLSSSDVRVHFGLGTETTPVTVTVKWPGGQTETFKNVAVGKYVTLVRGTSQK